IRKPNSPPYVYLSGNFCVDTDHHITAPARQIPACGWDYKSQKTKSLNQKKVEAFRYMSN
ncbi:MAG: hypothetical protein IIU60_01560, partial [Paraprevotella sp.]|nr:hypothetical protein [Paraprevotella sp.]